MTKQPEALRLADALEKYDVCSNVEEMPDLDQVAAELRRLNEVNAELVEALKACVDLLDEVAFWVEIDKARAAIKKATGEQA